MGKTIESIFDSHKQDFTGYGFSDKGQCCKLLRSLKNKLDEDEFQLLYSIVDDGAYHGCSLFFQIMQAE